MNTVLCTTTFLVWVLTLASAFVLISSANQEIDLQKTFEPGTSLSYDWRTTVLLNDMINRNNDSSSKNVGFALSGKVLMDVVWAGNDGKTIIKIKLESPQLHIQSRKNSLEKTTFLPHSSALENYKNNPFLLLRDKDGLIENIYIEDKENLALANIKKGIASMFQVQSNERKSSEKDSSGHCKIDYAIQEKSQAIVKQKHDCVSTDLHNKKFLDKVLGIEITSSRSGLYHVTEDKKVIEYILNREIHHLQSKTNQKLQSVIHTEDVLRLESNKNCDVLEETTVEKIIENISEKLNIKYSKQTLKTEKDSDLGTLPKFTKDVEFQRDNLKSENLGTVKSAKAFINLINSARTAKKEDIAKVLRSKKNSKILEQIFDILGYTQTKESHDAVMKILHLDSDEKLDQVERYLWALSLSPHPNADILEDLLNKYRKYSSIPQKIKNTLVLSIASMSRNLKKMDQHMNHETHKVLNTVEETIINDLDYAKGEEKYIYFAALKNLHSPSTIPTLIKYITDGTLKEEVLAWKAIRSFDKSLWPKELLKLAEKTLFQLDKKHDSSARTLTADIVLQHHISEEKLKDLLHFVISNETNYEVKQYVFQTIKMLSEKDETLDKLVTKLTKANPYLNNYSGLSPRGLSTALRRSVFSGISSNGSFVSVQEVKSGILKRGAVDVILDKHGVAKEIFSLGLFANGLTSFVSSDDSSEESSEEEEDNATAGMELTIMGTQIRPFVFFDGQGELMGHVWSGTASEMTNAFQANILLEDHSETIRLGNGFIADFDLKGVVSFDMSGKIEMSLWSRTAESLIEKSAGYLVNGLLKVDSSIVHSMIEFDASIEPKLSLRIDSDFSSGVKLCMRLLQPDTIYRHNVKKIEQIPSGNHKIKFSKNLKLNIPGRTYALNKKNNEICSAIFS